MYEVIYYSNGNRESVTFRDKAKAEYIKEVLRDFNSQIVEV